MERRLPRGRGGGRRQSYRQTPRPKLHVGRLALLVLVLVAAAFYLGPLRQFFAEQDRYQRRSAALEAARADNAALKRQIELLNIDSYVGQQAIADGVLVPPNTQVFVIEGLPGSDEEAEAHESSSGTAGSFSVFDRLEDLWRTLFG